MNTNLLSYTNNVNIGFAMFDHIFYSDSSLVFGDVLSAKRFRAMFEDSDGLFGYQIASEEVGKRPGRIEPRVIKRRRHKYPLMTKPRNQYKQAED